MQIPFKLAANLWKALKNEISYDYVVIEGYRTRTKKSYGKLSFHISAIGSWLRICFFESKDRIVLSTKPGYLRCTQNDTDLSCLSAVFLDIENSEQRSSDFRCSSDSNNDINLLVESVTMKQYEKQYNREFGIPMYGFVM